MRGIKQRYEYSLILLRELVITDFKLRYQGSVLGYLWSVLRPLALFGVLYIVFVKFLKVGEGIEAFPIYLLLGIVIWNFFVEITTGSVSAIVSRGDLIRKINFPKYVILLATSFSALINLAINMVVIAVFMVFNNIHVLPGHLYLVPLLIGEVYVFALALSFFLSAAFVRFRDIGYIWEVIMQGAFYATPILYPLSIIPIVAQKVLILNPVAQAIQELRYILVTQQSQTVTSIFGAWYWQLVPLAIVALTLVFAASYFKRQAHSFAENV